MRINNLHIAAFGKLSDVTMTFDPGMNLFSGDNEFGKSTILSFIRAMFYGFSGRSSNRMRDNDRRKFTPWNAKTFGGSIEFRHEGKTYLLEKTFSKRRADDRVTLTLLPSGQKTDLAQKEVGEYLFSVSEPEFVNTVFVGQLSSNILTTEKETDDISARLANLADTGSELYSHEEIKSRLVTAASKLAALRGTGGLIPRIENELADLEEKVIELEAVEEQAEILRREIDGALARQQKIEEELLVVARQIADRHKQREILAASLQNQEIRLQTALQKRRIEQEQAAVNAEFERARSEHLLQRQEMGRQFSEEYDRALEEVSRITIQNQKDRGRAELMIADLDAQLKNHEILLRENRALYENKLQETSQLEEEILDVSSEIKLLIQSREDVRKGLTTIISYKMKARRYEILFVAAFAVSIITYFILRDPKAFAGLIFLVMAAVLHISNYLQRRIIEKKIVEKSLAHEAKLKVYENASAALYDGQTTLGDCEKLAKELLINKLHIGENEDRDELYRTQLLTLAQDRLSACLVRKIGFADLSMEQPHTLEENQDDQEAAAEQENQEDADPQVLESRIRSDGQSLASLREDISIMMLREEKLKTDVSASRVEVARKETIRENLVSQEADRSWLLEQRSLLTDRRDEAKAYHRALTTAQSVLNEAFSEMENFFAPQVNEKAGEYFARLTEGAYSTLHVDRSFGIDIASEGAYSFHKTDFFSGGTVDQIYFALRLAISDLVQSSDDQMPLLLDDTFVQYDDKRAKAGLALLDELSLQRQIVLFTCHNRMSEIYESIKRDKGNKCE